MAGISACTRANANGKPERTSAEQRETARSSGESGLRPLKQEELSEDLMRVSERLLERHADEPIGTEVPFSHGGRRYVGRIEQHDNTTNDPNRPPGKHKGITLLVADR